MADFFIRRPIVAMVIATIKAGLVVTYFMHLRFEKGRCMK